MSEPTCWALCCRGAGCLSGVGTYSRALWDNGAGCLSSFQFLPPEQVRWAELDILLYFYFRTDQVKPRHMQLLLLRSAFLFRLREIYSVRMSTSEFGLIISLNKEILHLISVDPILKFEIV